MPANAPSDWPSNDLRVKPPDQDRTGLADMATILQVQRRDLVQAVTNRALATADRGTLATTDLKPFSTSGLSAAILHD